MARKVTAGHEALRQSEHGGYSNEFTHDVVAVNSDGQLVFKTEALAPHQLEGALEDYPSGEDAPAGVDHYEIRER